MFSLVFARFSMSEIRVLSIKTPHCKKSCSDSNLITELPFTHEVNILMARVLILSTHHKVDDLNRKICHFGCCSDKYNDMADDIEAILDRSFYTTCPDCIARFMADIAKLGLFKCYWEPKVFVRNKAEFFHETNKYYLKLTIAITDKEMRLANRQFGTHFAGLVTLKIENKYDSKKSKSVKLFDLHCDSLSKTLKNEYLDKMREYIDTTFGIDFKRWNEILTDKVKCEVIESTF